MVLDGEGNYLLQSIPVQEPGLLSNGLILTGYESSVFYTLFGQIKPYVLQRRDALSLFLENEKAQFPQVTVIEYRVSGLTEQIVETVKADVPIAPCYSIMQLRAYCPLSFAALR